MTPTDQLVRDFLAKGGSITQLPPEPAAPIHTKWVEEMGSLITKLQTRRRVHSPETKAKLRAAAARRAQKSRGVS